MAVIIAENIAELESNLKIIIEQISREAIANRNIFKVGLSGGSVLKFLTNAILTFEDDLSKWKLFFCDERVVPENSADSTYGAYKSNLIDKGLLKEEQFIKIKQGVNASEAAIDYTEQMKQYFEADSLPKFDLLLLGMGPDGHICSLFPQHKLLDEKSLWIAAIDDSPKPPPSRITLTLPVVNNARNCLFALAGEEKAEITKKAIIDKDQALPAARVNPTAGNLYWIVEKGAAKYLN